MDRPQANFSAGEAVAAVSVETGQTYLDRTVVIDVLWKEDMISHSVITGELGIYTGWVYKIMPNVRGCMFAKETLLRPLPDGQLDFTEEQHELSQEVT